MNDAARQRYRLRFQRVLDYIDTHLDENPGVDALSRVTHFSRFHFHRQFSEYVGIGVGRYVQLLRLRRAACQLAFREDLRVTDVALAAGFERPETFSRAFRKWFGQSPVAFRKAPAWEPWHGIVNSLYRKENASMKQHHGDNEVRIEAFRETPIAVLEHRGAPEGLNETLRIFIAWRRRFGPSPRVSDTYNLVYHDPATTPAEEYRFGIAASVDGDVADNDYGVVRQVIPAGRCAVLRHVGPDRNIGESVRMLYREWLPASGEELRDFPIFFHRIKLFPDVPESEMLTDVYLPLQ